MHTLFRSHIRILLKSYIEDSSLFSLLKLVVKACNPTASGRFHDGDLLLNHLKFDFMLDDLETIKVIGKGSGGVVQLVHHKNEDLNALRDDLMELKPTLFFGIPRAFEKVYEGIKKAVEELNPVRRTVFGMLYNYRLLIVETNLYLLEDIATWS